MTAQVVEFSGASLRRKLHTRAEPKTIRAAQASPAHDFQFWTGASGRRYVHTIHSLIWCPEVPRANYILVRRGADGRRLVLRIGRVEQDAPSLNLAELRQAGATLGANEVHVHLLAGTASQRRFVETDLDAAQGHAVEALAASR